MLVRFVNWRWVCGAAVGKYGCKCAAQMVLFWLTPLVHDLRSTVGSGSRDVPVLQIACTMIIYPEEFLGPTRAPLTRRASFGMVSISIEGVAGRKDAADDDAGGKYGGKYQRCTN